MSSPPFSKSCNRAGLFKRPVRSSASSRWLQALVQNRKQLRFRSFVLAAWPSCRGPRQPAANELGGGPVRHVRPTDLERLAGPSAPSSATPHIEFDLSPRISQRPEMSWCMRSSPSTSPARPSVSVFVLKTDSKSLIGYIRQGHPAADGLAPPGLRFGAHQGEALGSGESPAPQGG